MSNFRATTAVTLLALSSFQQVAVRANDVLHDAVDGAFAFAGEQLRALESDRLQPSTTFTSYTTEDGEWITEKSNGDTITQTVWTSGMVAGMYWLQYEATGEVEMKNSAESIQTGLEGVETLDDNDTGFQVLNSFGLGYRLTGSDAFKERVIVGAETLFDNRFVNNIPAFWSWNEPSRRPEWERAVNVDMIMNMEIMLWAAVNGGDPFYNEAVLGHADSTWKYIVRDDYSTFHVADFDPDTGALVDQGTYQGAFDESTWSRGQAWAIYGYTMVFRYLRDNDSLGRALDVFKYFDDNLPADFVPFADFDAPEDDINPKDSSSTAIVASALLELFQLTGEPIYLEKAETYLSALLLSPEYFDPEATDGWEALLRRSSSEHDAPEVGSVTGDYFTLETMTRYKAMGVATLLTGGAAEASVSAAQSSIEFSGGDLNDVDISGLSDDTPVVVRFGITLEGQAVPDTLTIGGASVDIPVPSGGWTSGTNTVSFTVAAGGFSAAATSVGSVTVGFASTMGTTTAVVHHIIVGHRFSTSLADDGEDEGATAAPGNFEEIGCFTDTKDERIKIGMLVSADMTPELCSAHCEGSIFFGLQYAEECWCDRGEGDVDSPYAVHGPSSTCDMPCTGDADVFCGGFYAMSVYENL